jgi:hypothetical protein
MTPLHVAKALDRPICKRCHTGMMLARIAPDGPGFEPRQFECPKCDQVYTEHVPNDPMAGCKGWLSGELRPPT